MSSESSAIKVHVAAAVVIKKDGKYLLVQEAQASCRGKWTTPAGKIDIGETLEEGAIREAKEETGFDVKILRHIGIFHTEATHAVKHAYEGEIVGGELAVPQDELLDVKWFTYPEIEEMKDQLRNEWVFETITVVENSTSRD